MASANPADTADTKKGPSLAVQALVMLFLTLLAVGGGWLAGSYLKNGAPSEPAGPVPMIVEPVRRTAAEKNGRSDAAKDAAGETAAPLLVHLEPVTTNLAAPSDVWVRLELSIVFSAAPGDPLVRAIHQDMLAYMRTLTLQQVEGASGLHHLKTDIEERARLRSNGLATELMIRTLLFE